MLKTGVQGLLANNNALEVCYDPIIQSGEQCTLKFNTERYLFCSLIQFISYNCITHKLQGFYIVIFSNEKILHYGSIVSTIGIRYLVRRIGFDFIILSFK